jgi:hypothetical protein
MKNFNKGTAEDVRGANLDCLLYKSNAAVSKPVIAHKDQTYLSNNFHTPWASLPLKL